MKAPGQTLQCLSEGQSVGDAEVVAGRHASGANKFVQPEFADAPRWQPRLHRVDQDHRPIRLEVLQKGRARAIQGQQLGAAVEPRSPKGLDRPPTEIVTGHWRTDPDDTPTAVRIVARHRRCTRTFRKCVAQEMHGS